MSQPKRKKRQFEVLLTSTGVHRVIVEGYTPEDALRIMHRKIAGKVISDNVVESVRIEDVWSDPSDKGEAWIVAPAVKSEQSPEKLMTWDGKTIHTYNAKDILWDFVKASGKKGKTW